jgi:hypothetical protein
MRHPDLTFSAHLVMPSQRKHELGHLYFKNNPNVNYDFGSSAWRWMGLGSGFSATRTYF